MSVKICVLLRKLKARLRPVEADYVGFNIGDEFVVGYGLDYMERYRNLPCIGVLRKEKIRPPQLTSLTIEKAMRYEGAIFFPAPEIVGASEITSNFRTEPRSRICSRSFTAFPALEKWDDSILIGAGRRFCRARLPPSANDEIAIMPPVQGG